MSSHGQGCAASGRRSGDIMDANDALVMKALVDEIIVHDTGIEIHSKCGITIEQEYVQ